MQRSGRNAITLPVPSMSVQVPSVESPPAAIPPDRLHAAASGSLAGEPALPAPASRTFARKRLLLGISGVGTSVVASVVWLLLLLLGVVPVPPTLNPSAGGASGAFAVSMLLLGVFAAHALLVGTLEYIGGARVVRESQTLRRWLPAWLRGVGVQALLFSAFGAAAALAAQQIGLPGVLAVVLGGGTMLIAGQALLAPLVAGLRVRRVDALIGSSTVAEALEGAYASGSLSAAELSELALANGIHPDVLRVVEVADEAFVGGWVGVGRAELWIPARWVRTEHRELLGVQLARRYAQRMSGARRRGLWRAAVWPALGLALFMPLLPWTVDEAAFWLALPAVSTIWTFVAVLLLPSFSRPVVYSADAAAAARLGTGVVQRAIRQLDRWQDDEPERTPGVEFIFHPVPSRGNRERALELQRRPALGGAHQQTRLTLCASLAAFGLLGRVVHCNIGRPALWVLYPGD